VEQLKEVYGISDSSYKQLLPYIDFVADLELLEINANTVVELRRHPYISYRQAKSIVSYRRMHGPFNHVGDLHKIHNLDSSWLNKVEPYLSFY
jgi:DNA uptake protein ComE-like DNA-binding protein